MHIHKNRLYFSTLAGLVALFAAFPSQGVDTSQGIDNLDAGPFVLVTYFLARDEDTIECLVADPGYVDLLGLTQPEIDSIVLREVYDEPRVDVEDPYFEVYHLNTGLPVPVADEKFNIGTLAADGHAYAIAALKLPSSPEQILTLNTAEENGEETYVLYHGYDPDLNYDCNVIEMTEEMDGSTGTLVKKAKKRKIAKASKRKVNKKKAKRKAAKRKKSAPPG